MRTGVNPVWMRRVEQEKWPADTKLWITKWLGCWPTFINCYHWHNQWHHRDIKTKWRHTSCVISRDNSVYMYILFRYCYVIIITCSDFCLVSIYNFNNNDNHYLFSKIEISEIVNKKWKKNVYKIVPTCIEATYKAICMKSVNLWFALHIESGKH